MRKYNYAFRISTYLLCVYACKCIASWVSHVIVSEMGHSWQEHCQILHDIIVHALHIDIYIFLAMEQLYCFVQLKGQEPEWANPK